MSVYRYGRLSFAGNSKVATLKGAWLSEEERKGNICTTSGARKSIFCAAEMDEKGAEAEEERERGGSVGQWIDTLQYF